MMGGDHPSKPVIECSDILGSKPKVLTQIIAFKRLHAENWLGCKISFPLPKDQVANEDAGFGVRYNRKLVQLGCLGLLQLSFIANHLSS
jgi:hypothetical protein